MRCPYCQTENASGATRCAACTSWMVDRPPVRDWTRARSGRMIAGVARGLSNRFGLACAAVRLAFLLSILCGGWGIVVYIAMWIAMPEEPYMLPASTHAAPPAGPEPQRASAG